MKKILLYLFFILLIAAAFIGWKVMGPSVSAPEGKYFYIHNGAKYEDVRNSLAEQKIISGTFFFDKLSSAVKYKNIKPGRYEIRDRSSLLSLLRMLKAGNQSPVKLVINKLRTKEDLASKISRNFDCDSSAVINFLTSNDSLALYQLDTNTVMTAVIPDTYSMYWNSSFKNIFSKLKNYAEKFWTEDRLKKAAAKNLTPVQVYTLASIVEEETNKAEDKPLVASVYRNRLAKGEKLQADPTIKYSMRNFALTRIYEKYLFFDSPYNTYMNKGLPPGPICTPSSKTIDAVLDSPDTDYMFFVARPDFSGHHVFTTNYEDHMKEAKIYQHFLDSLATARKQN